MYSLAVAIFHPGQRVQGLDMGTGYSPYTDMPTGSGQSLSRKISLSQTFDHVSYQEVDTEQRIQFEALLKEVCLIRCKHVRNLV